MGTVRPLDPSTSTLACTRSLGPQQRRPMRVGCLVLLFLAVLASARAEDLPGSPDKAGWPVSTRPALPLPADGLQISLSQNGVLRIGSFVPRNLEDLQYLDNRLFPSLAPPDGLAGPRYEPGKPDPLLFLVDARASLRDFARIEAVLSGANQWGDSYPKPPPEDGAISYDRVFLRIDAPNGAGALPLWKRTSWQRITNAGLRCGEILVRHGAPPSGMGAYFISIVNLVPLDAGGFLVSLGSISQSGDSHNAFNGHLWRSAELPERLPLWLQGESHDHGSATYVRLVEHPRYFSTLPEVARLVAALSRERALAKDTAGSIVDVHLLARHDQSKVPVQVLVDAIDTLSLAGARSVRLMPHFWPQKVIEVQKD